MGPVEPAQSFRKMMELMLVMCALTSVLAEERDPKLLFVSSSTSTTMATATSTASGTFTCYILSKTDFKACTGRRKKRAISLIEDGGLPVDLETPEITISKVQRSLPSAEIDSGNVDPIEANREAKFAWYYMTTTITSSSTSTSISTSYTTTMSISLNLCTPTSFVGCGS